MAFKLIWSKRGWFGYNPYIADKNNSKCSKMPGMATIFICGIVVFSIFSSGNNFYPILFITENFFCNKSPMYFL